MPLAGPLCWAEALHAWLDQVELHCSICGRPVVEDQPACRCSSGPAGPTD
jgi:hypothetical protein